MQIHLLVLTQIKIKNHAESQIFFLNHFELKTLFKKIKNYIWIHFVHALSVSLANILYSLEINELIQSSQVEVFINWSPAKNASEWVKWTFPISSNLSYKCIIDTLVFTTHSCSFGECQHLYFICLYISRCFSSWNASIITSVLFFSLYSQDKGVGSFTVQI